MTTIPEVLARAKTHHRAGQLQPAEQLYREILQVDPANAEVHYLLGAACRALGKPHEAVASLQQAVRLKPDHVAAHNHLGVTLAQQGRLDEAIACFRQALRLQPDFAEAHNNLRKALAQLGQRQLPAGAAQRSTEEADSATVLNNRGAALAQQRKWDEAAACYRRALELQPDFATAHNNLGNVLKEQGKREEAIACYQRALQLRPDFAGAHNNLALAWQEQGKLDEAVAGYRRSLELNPNYVETHNNLGTVLQKQGKLDEAAACYRQALQLRPGYAEAHSNLGVALQGRGKLAEAAACQRRALELKPEFAEAHTNLGIALQAQGKLTEAAACHRRALELRPDYPAAYNNLALVLQEQGKVDEAVACYQGALQLKPDYPQAHNNLATALKIQGKLAEAAACYQRALELAPDFAEAHSNCLLCQHYHPDVTLAALAASHADWDRRHGIPLQTTWRPAANDRTADRRLRLGFVSADFGRHPVGWFVVRVLEELRGHDCEIVCYSERGTKDDITARIEAAAGAWRDVQGLAHAALAEQIRADGIDILFDLAGHTAKNRLPVFARKPAPIQVTWLGYVGTTGLSAMDYLLADRWEIPEGMEKHYHEQVLRLPDGYVCYDPPAYAPPVGALPALGQGHVTFGSFNNPGKINPAVAAVWAEILRRMPTSRLVLKYAAFDDPGNRRRYEDLFAAAGADPSRLELLGWSAHQQLLAEYQRIDVALDPFPYSGGLTTCEALWMGVPVITYPGETFAGRHSLSHLSNVGLTETAARDLSHYVDLAAKWASDLPRLADLRAQLRGRMARSPLCDGPRFAANLMHTLRALWRQCCEAAR
jgi:predicted O-linked N-acetylglucosamine transferase (SPINDLY family)